MRRSFWNSVNLGLAAALSSALSLQAHEFWLQPLDFTLDEGAPLQVEWRNGEKMEGVEIPYLPQGPVRLEVVIGDQAIPYKGRLGDSPAITMTPPGPGLALVVMESIDTILTYEDFAKFERFVTHKRLGDILAQHAARGLPQIGFGESYRRYTKALVAVGAGTGADRPMGLRIEIVALANPYTDDLTAGMPLQLYLDGQPRPDTQVSLFAAAPDGTVSETFYLTDAEGKVTVPAVPGHSYLADAVDFYALPNDDTNMGPVWHSDWASLTYQLP